MNTYVVFFAFTQQGIERIKDSPGRVEAARQTVEAMGGGVKGFYALLGSEFDTMFIVEAPDEEAVAKAALAIAAAGNVRTRTHRALTEGEFGKLVSSLD
jgi:uncharacterized protein with GYD domain